MNSMLHIAPQLPPAIDGVGDYCANLWQHWPDLADPWEFATLAKTEKPRTAGETLAWECCRFPTPPVHRFSPGADELAGMLQGSTAGTVVLHYVGYGYQPKGIPVWLPRALERWKQNGSGRLVTMFHEMYAESSPLRSPFWVKPWARQIIRDLVRLSDKWITSCERYFEWLVEEFQASPDRGVRIPIASNVPRALEFADARLWPLEFGRKLRVVVFGLPSTRIWALEAHAEFLRALVAADLVESVLLLGRSSQSERYLNKIHHYRQRVGGEWHGEFDLPAAQIADSLAECDIGLIANDPGTLTKSGVFAALATNGVISIVAHRGNSQVRPPFADCVLLNDETRAGCDNLIAELRGANRMIARRRTTLRVAEAELSWRGVAESFRGVIIQPAVAESNASLAFAPPSARLLAREVRA